jgi:hypothetical protein
MIQTKLENQEDVKEILRAKYTTLENSGIARDTFAKWKKKLPKPIKKFFEISRKSGIDPNQLFELFINEEDKVVQN